VEQLVLAEKQEWRFALGAGCIELEETVFEVEEFQFNVEFVATLGALDLDLEDLEVDSANALERETLHCEFEILGGVLNMLFGVPNVLSLNENIFFFLLGFLFLFIFLFRGIFPLLEHFLQLVPAFLSRLGLHILGYLIIPLFFLVFQ